MAALLGVLPAFGVAASGSADENLDHLLPKIDGSESAIQLPRLLPASPHELAELAERARERPARPATVMLCVTILLGRLPSRGLGWPPASGREAPPDAPGGSTFCADAAAAGESLLLRGEGLSFRLPLSMTGFSTFSFSPSIASAPGLRSSIRLAAEARPPRASGIGSESCRASGSGSEKRLRDLLTFFSGDCSSRRSSAEERPCHDVEEFGLGSRSRPESDVDCPAGLVVRLRMLRRIVLQFVELPPMCDAELGCDEPVGSAKSSSAFRRAAQFAE